jgi:type II secretory ATPase GspE/PulE/Tfp pilus assembly ATPase PilB-like protein
MGRMLVAEGFYADSTIHELILKRRPLGEIREAQVAQGGLTLLQQGVRAAASGKIPLSVALALGSSAMT